MRQDSYYLTYASHNIMQKATGVVSAAQIMVHEGKPLLNGLSKLTDYGVKSGIVYNTLLSKRITYFIHLN